MAKVTVSLDNMLLNYKGDNYVHQTLAARGVKFNPDGTLSSRGELERSQGRVAPVLIHQHHPNKTRIQSEFDTLTDHQQRILIEEIIPAIRRGDTLKVERNG